MELAISGIFFIKFLALVAIALFGALFCLWPINDQPVSRAQKLVYVLVLVIATTALFCNISFTFTH